MRGTLPHYMPSTSGLWYFNKMPTPNRLGMDSNAPFASDFHQQRNTKLVGTLPATWEENNPLFIRGEHILSLRISSGSSQTSYTIKKNINYQSAKKAQNGPFASFFSKLFSGRPRPPPPTAREQKKKPLPLLGFIWSSTAKVKILPYHVYRQSEIWRQNYMRFFFWEINTNYTKKAYSGKPWTPTLLREDKKMALWSSKVEVLILPQHVYRSFEGKIIHTILEEKSLRIMQKQMGS